MPYPISTIAMIIYFFLVGLAGIGLFALPGLITAIVALVVAVALLARV